MKRFMWLAIVSFVLLMSFGMHVQAQPKELAEAVTGTATAQQAAPTENKGVTVTLLTALDLGTEIPGMQGRRLRLVMITIEPGGAIMVHSHKDRPEVTYVLKGTITEHRGDVVSEHHAGESQANDRNVTHWLENKGAGPAVEIIADVFKQR